MAVRTGPLSPALPALIASENGVDAWRLWLCILLHAWAASEWNESNVCGTLLGPIALLLVLRVRDPDSKSIIQNPSNGVDRCPDGAREGCVTLVVLPVLLRVWERLLPGPHPRRIDHGTVDGHGGCGLRWGVDRGAFIWLLLLYFDFGMPTDGLYQYVQRTLV